MKQLKDILYNVKLDAVAGDTAVVVTSVCFDSRQVNEGSLFVAVKGTQVDGHKFIKVAIDSGAIAIVCEEMPVETYAGITYISSPNTSESLGIIAANFYDNPSKKIKLIGVTGTNGKTTSVTLMYKLFKSLGYRVGMLSTVENRIQDEVIKSSHTTPDQISLNELLDKMVNAGCSYVFMEVSSHAIDQNRIAGVEFSGAVFMNITHDHLDYHGTFDHYIGCKKRLFDDLNPSAFALVNMDDKRGQVMFQNTKARQVTFGLKFMTDFKAKVITNSYQGLELDVDGKSVWFRLIGQFNAYNLLAAYGVACELGEDPDDVLMMLSGIEAASGRFESIANTLGVVAIVDYAHTPDALENVLKTIDSFRTGNETVITVVGCGGDRDKSKRPLMGSIATKWSDKVIFTDDNPRSEDPEEIIEQINSGVSRSLLKKVLRIRDRQEAIKTACSIAETNDIILVAGKGHETYQEVAGIRYDFDDKLVLRDMLELFKD